VKNKEAAALPIKGKDMAVFCYIGNIEQRYFWNYGKSTLQSGAHG